MAAGLLGEELLHAAYLGSGVSVVSGWVCWDFFHASVVAYMVFLEYPGTVGAQVTAATLAVLPRGKPVARGCSRPVRSFCRWFDSGKHVMLSLWEKPAVQVLKLSPWSTWDDGSGSVDFYSSNTGNYPPGLRLLQFFELDAALLPEDASRGAGLKEL